MAVFSSPPIIRKMGITFLESKSSMISIHSYWYLQWGLNMTWVWNVMFFVQRHFGIGWALYLQCTYFKCYAPFQISYILSDAVLFTDSRGMHHFSEWGPVSSLWALKGVKNCVLLYFGVTFRGQNEVTEKNEWHHWICHEILSNSRFGIF